MAGIEVGTDIEVDTDITEADIEEVGLHLL
jgi:hypothetical protein